MAEFKVEVVKIDEVVDHDNADRLTIISIGGYRCIANKKDDGSWRYQTGDEVVYIPEGSVLPEWLLKRLDMWNDEKGVGYLAGSRGNRVKAMKLRGVLSQGVLYPVNSTEGSQSLEVDNLVDDTLNVTLGDNVAEYLGIIKYEPPIPSSMGGEVAAQGSWAFKYDVENFKNYTFALHENEEVIFTEKLHGTFMGIGFVPGLNHAEMPGNGNALVFSKGLGGQGLMFKDNGKNASNVYMQMFHELNDSDALLASIANFRSTNDLEVNDEVPIFILGELFGAGVQDLAYGHIDGKKSFRGFDIYIGHPGHGFYLDADEKASVFKLLGLDQVPILWRGPWSVEKAEEFCKGTDTISKSHVREGIVINTANERQDASCGRVQLKFINPKYLLRKGNTTEFN